MLFCTFLCNLSYINAIIQVQGLFEHIMSKWSDMHILCLFCLCELIKVKATELREILFLVIQYCLLLLTITVKAKYNLKNVHLSCFCVFIAVIYMGEPPLVWSFFSF